jgi:hypothetical protein
MDFPMSIMDAHLCTWCLWTNFWQQYIIGIRDVLGHHAGQLCIKFLEDILIIARCTVRFIGVRQISRLADLPAIETDIPHFSILIYLELHQHAKGNLLHRFDARKS